MTNVIEWRTDWAKSQKPFHPASLTGICGSSNVCITEKAPHAALAMLFIGPTHASEVFATLGISAHLVS